MNILEITMPGAIETLTTPAAAANPGDFEKMLDIGFELKKSLEGYSSVKPGRMRAASLCAPQIGEDVNMFIMYYVPEGSDKAVWRVFVNPVVTPTADAQLLEDKNFSLSTPFIRTQIDRPDKVEIKADFAFDILPIGASENIRYQCYETMQRNYTEVLQERLLTENEMAREGLKKPNLNGNAFIAQFSKDMLDGVSPVHHVPAAQMKTFIENNQNGENLRGVADQNGNPPTSAQLGALKKFYEAGRPRVWAMAQKAAPALTL